MGLASQPDRDSIPDRRDESAGNGKGDQQQESQC
jgi:hypothetical protein